MKLSAPDRSLGAMAVVLRLLLVLCLVGTAVPAPMAHAATVAHAAATADAGHGAMHDDDLPPCHGGGAASKDTAPAPPAPDCCADGGACNGTCGGGCGCVHAAGLPTAMVPTDAAAVPEGPPATAIRLAAPPRLPPPVRPPIA